MTDTYKYKALREEIVDLMMQCDQIRVRMKRINDELGLRIRWIALEEENNIMIENGIEVVAEFFRESDPNAYEDESKRKNGTSLKYFMTGETWFMQEQNSSIPVYKKWRE